MVAFGKELNVGGEPAVHLTVNNIKIKATSEPGWATSLIANSRWTMNTAHRNIGLCASILKITGLEIWYGRFATHISKKGHLVLIASPMELILRDLR